MALDVIYRDKRNFANETQCFCVSDTDEKGTDQTRSRRYGDRAQLVKADIG
jgi:hypothetical protein